MVGKRNHPQMAFIQVSETIIYPDVSIRLCIYLHTISQCALIFSTGWLHEAEMCGSYFRLGMASFWLATYTEACSFLQHVRSFRNTMAIPSSNYDRYMKLKVTLLRVSEVQGISSIVLHHCFCGCDKRGQGWIGPHEQFQHWGRFSRCLFFAARKYL